MSKGVMAHESVVTTSKMYFKMLKLSFLFGVFIIFIYSFFLTWGLVNNFKILNYKDKIIKLTTMQVFNFMIKNDVNIYIKKKIEEYFDKKTKLVKEKIPLNLTPLLPPNLQNKKINQNKFNELIKKIILINNKKNIEIYFNRLKITPYFLLLFMVGYNLFFVYKSHHGDYFKTRLVKGIEVIDKKEYALIKNEKVKNEERLTGEKVNLNKNLKIDNIYLKREDENKHMFIMGGTGSGKSVKVKNFLLQIQDRIKKYNTNERLLFVDYSGEMFSAFYEEGDILFNPLDERGTKWNIFNEFDEPFYAVQTQNFADLLFKPLMKDEKNAMWYQGASSILTTILNYLLYEHYEGERTINNNILWNTVNLPHKDLLTQIKASGMSNSMKIGLKLIDDGNNNDNTTVKNNPPIPPSTSVQNFLQIMYERVKFFQFLLTTDNDDAKDTFSIKSFVNEDKYKGKKLFITIPPEYESTITAINTFITTAYCNKVLGIDDQDKNDEKRYWFICDELGAIEKIPVLANFVSGGRKKGAACILATQDMAKVEQIYGEKLAKNIINNTSTIIVGYTKEPNAQKYFADLLVGTVEKKEKNDSISISPQDMGDRLSIGEQHTHKAGLLPSELASLEPHEAYITNSDLPKKICKIKPKMPDFKNLLKNEKNFIPRNVSIIKK